jgi:hypothetical protein
MSTTNRVDGRVNGRARGIVMYEMQPSGASNAWRCRTLPVHAYGTSCHYARPRRRPRSPIGHQGLTDRPDCAGVAHSVPTVLKGTPHAGGCALMQHSTVCQRLDGPHGANRTGHARSEQLQEHMHAPVHVPVACSCMRGIGTTQMPPVTQSCCRHSCHAATYPVHTAAE